MDICRIRAAAQAVFATVLLGASVAAHAALITYTATLGPEVPGATGSGSVEVVYDNVAHTLSIDADWSGLSGLTTVAHIHCCTALPGTGTVGVAVTPGTLPGFPTGLMSGSYLVTGLDLTSTATYTSGFVTNFGGGTAAGAEAALFAGLNAGTAYFNIHTTTFGGGEIRGFLERASVPEPGTMALLGLGLVGLTVARRRK